MNQAVAAHMSIGRDIIFTFGPYVFLYTQTYQPLIDDLMMGCAIYLALSVCKVTSTTTRSPAT